MAIWGLLNIGFEELVRAHQKAIPVIAKEEGGITPRFYIRVLVEMEDTVNEVWEDKDARCVMLLPGLHYSYALLYLSSS